MNIVKLLLATRSNARISLPIKSIRLLGWGSGDDIVVTVNEKTQEIVLRKLEERK